MNDYLIILRTLAEQPLASQRELAKALNASLGKTNKLMHACAAEGYLELCAAQQSGKGRSTAYVLTEKGKKALSGCQVDCALILASGFGSRFVPLTYETPKGLLRVFGERMIERQICQLHAVGITDITIMVGYLKEKFDYLIDKYGVKLRYNPEYQNKNTLATMYHARDIYAGKNCYVLSSDNWMRENMYHRWEPYAWYAASFMEGDTREWALRCNRKGEITDVSVGGSDAWCMYGPVYFSRAFSEQFIPLLEAYYKMPGTEQFYWEDVYIRNIRNLPPLCINRQPENQVYEFENLEELRAFDERYVNDSGSRAMQLVSKVFAVPESQIVNIRCMKAGMTNKSWLFELSGKAFICRIPGQGTEKLINRRQEAAVYEAVKPLGITDEVYYFDPQTGYRISRYYHGARNADFTKAEELQEAMQMLKRLHNSGICVAHSFDIRERIDWYEQLCRATGQEIPFEDYSEVRRKADEVMAWLDSLKRPHTLAHIDGTYDNFIVTDEGLKLIDWEYSGMADPLIDLGMCAIYSYMNFEEAEALLNIYVGIDGGVALAGCKKEQALQVVYAYMGLGGLLWALWGVYKSMQGEQFGDYTLKMYRYMKDVYKKLKPLLGSADGKL